MAIFDQYNVQSIATVPLSVSGVQIVTGSSDPHITRSCEGTGEPVYNTMTSYSPNGCNTVHMCIQTNRPHCGNILLPRYYRIPHYRVNLYIQPVNSGTSLICRQTDHTMATFTAIAARITYSSSDAAWK